MENLTTNAVNVVRTAQPVEKKFVEVKGQNGKISVQKDLWGKYSPEGVGDVIDLKNGVRIGIFERLKKEKPCDITVEDFKGRTDIKVKDATVLVRTKNNKKDSIALVPEENAHIIVEKDSNDLIQSFEQKNNYIQVN